MCVVSADSLDSGGINIPHKKNWGKHAQCCVLACRCFADLYCSCSGSYNIWKCDKEKAAVKSDSDDLWPIYDCCCLDGQNKLSCSSCRKDL